MDHRNFHLGFEMTKAHQDSIRELMARERRARQAVAERVDRRSAAPKLSHRLSRALPAILGLRGAQTRAVPAIEPPL
ncbi:MAG TPA: hypothetical protein VNL71_02165 [Chloroflexota bacterium]|nr:hypothetical protein [Chloroflexota bacterium]